ncbi:MAG: protein-glutamate O-methyltransferase CheR [Chitinophagaceae bacterium]|nr:MAG: protein-glutamate O-methyltransferase CheR [Chitinophagaceae bacterium]
MDLIDDELEILLADLLDLHGYDFNNYSRASLLRRVRRLMQLDKFSGFADFRMRILTDKDYIKRFIEEITVNVTEMFRDPSFYVTLRKKVLPELATHPFIRIWHAGCSTGEEVYSMAILLYEAGLLDRTLIYATDINPDVVEEAKKGIFSLSLMKQYSENYIKAGGLEDFSYFYTAQYSKVIFKEQLRKRIIFATHNLVSDASFNEFQLILCRNVLIYFDKELQDRVLQTFDNSLEPEGFLALGSKETLRFSGIGNRYVQMSPEKIWRKKK